MAASFTDSSTLGRYTFLDGPSKWDAWELDFCRFCGARNILQYVRASDRLPLPEVPERPVPLPDKALSGAIENFRVDVLVWERECKEHDRVHKNVHTMMDWIVKTVSDEYKRVACDANKTLPEWYDSLKVALGQDIERQIRDCRMRY